MRNPGQSGATISVLIRGTLRVEFHTGDTPQLVILAKEGDYVVYGPEVVHSCEAIGDTLVVSIRFPSVEVGGRAGMPVGKTDSPTVLG